MILGKLTITGRWPLAIDGLDLGYSPRRTLTFIWRSDGFERAGKLYKTREPQALLIALGVQKAKFNLLTKGKCDVG